MSVKLDNPIVWVGSVMRENLEVDGNIPGIVFVTADSFAAAIVKIQKDTRKQVYFKPGKSVIRIRNLFPLLELGETVQVIDTHELSAMVAGPSSFQEIFTEDQYKSYAKPPRDDIPPEGLVPPTEEKPKRRARKKAPAESEPAAGGRRRRKRA